MPLNLENYRVFDTWGGIRKFVLTHKDKYPLKDSSDDAIKKMIRINAQDIFDTKTFESFRKLLDNLVKESNGTKLNTISRENAYRFLAALKIDNLVTANELLTGYLNQHELCPRLLKEFIILSGYKINLSWAEEQTLIKQYDDKIKDMPSSPNHLEYGQTLEMARAIENSDILTVDEIVLLVNTFMPYFSRTRNTQFLDFFDDIDFTQKEEDEKIFKYIQKERAKGDFGYIEDERGDELYRTILHINCYELDSDSDFENGTEESFSQEDINRLAVIFPNTFVSYGTFCHYIKRDNVSDMCGGLYFFKLLRELEPEDLLDDEEIDSEIKAVNYSDYTETMDLLKKMLSEDGFPTINQFDPFYRLFMDTYKEVLKENPRAFSSEIQDALFSRLKKYLRQILEDDKKQ